MHVFRALRYALERMLAEERFAESGPFESRRAHERSLNLLVACLTPVQRAEFARSKAFEVRGESGQCYRITYSKSMNIEVLAPSGIVLRRLCAAPVDLPIPAVMLAQKLMLETQEAEFLRIARVIPTDCQHLPWGFAPVAQPTRGAFHRQHAGPREAAGEREVLIGRSSHSATH